MGVRHKGLSLFPRQRVDSSRQEVAAASKGEVNFGFNPLQSAAHTQSNGILPDAFIRGATVSSTSTPQSHYQPRSPTTLISNQPTSPQQKKKDTKAKRSKACGDYWLSGLALRKWFLDKSRALGFCSRKTSTCLRERSGASGTTLLTREKRLIILAAEFTCNLSAQ